MHSSFLAFLHLIAIIATVAPLIWPDIPAQIPLFIRHLGDDTLEESSVLIFQYMSFVLTGVIVLPVIRIRRRIPEQMTNMASADNLYRMAISRVFPVHTLLRWLLVTSLVGVALAYYDYNHGELLGILLFSLQTIPIVLMVEVSVRSNQMGVTTLTSVIVVSSFLLLLPLQFLQNWLILTILFLAYPAMLLWFCFVVVRMAKMKREQCFVP
jgi:hypothetical protein